MSNKVNIPEEFILKNVILKKTDDSILGKRLAVLHENTVHLAEFMPGLNLDYSIENEKSYIDYCKLNWDLGKIYDFSMFDKEGQEYLGSIRIAVTSSSRGHYEFGYWITEKYQGRGYVSEAVNALSDFLLNNLNAFRVMIQTNLENSKSANLALRNEFLLEHKSYNSCKEKDLFCFVKLKSKSNMKELSAKQEQLKEIFNF